MNTLASCLFIRSIWFLYILKYPGGLYKDPTWWRGILQHQKSHLYIFSHRTWRINLKCRLHYSFKICFESNSPIASFTNDIHFATKIYYKFYCTHKIYFLHILWWLYLNCTIDPSRLPRSTKMQYEKSILGKISSLDILEIFRDKASKIPL